MLLIQFRVRCRASMSARDVEVGLVVLFVLVRAQLT